ncbi:MAG: hypothetical protein IPK68_15620 [Bdellovibrionales bacterium]|nr:hypothetical protein [Bdellovibrionales bacterium]
MSNRNTYSHTVIREACWISAQTNARTKKQTAAPLKQGTQACAYQPIKLLIALTFIFAGALYADPASADFLSKARDDIKREAAKVKLPPIAVVVPLIVPDGAPHLLPAITKAPENIVKAGVKAVDDTLKIVGKAGEDANDTLIKGRDDLNNTVIKTLSDTRETVVTTQEDIEDTVHKAGKDSKKLLNYLGDVCSLGEDGRKRDREREEAKEERQRVVRDGARVLRNEQISQTRRLLNVKKDLIATLERLDADNEVIFRIMASNNKIFRQFLLSSENTADNLMAVKLLLASQFATLLDYADRTSSQIPQVETQDNGTKDEMSLRALIEKFQVEMTILKNDQEQGAISSLDALARSYNYSTLYSVAIRERLKTNQDAVKKEVSSHEESLKILESEEGASK